MITAKEVQNISNNFNRDKQQLEVILSETKRCAENGYGWATITLSDFNIITVSKTVLANLKNLGFKYCTSYDKLEVYWS